MRCDNCIGKGYTISSVTGRLADCNVCDTTGELDICASFDPGVVISGFRNRRCISCGARENFHKVLTSQAA